MSSNFRANFEKQLRDKLIQKTSSFQSEESILIKNFRFFDLDNSGTVEFDEFKKAIEKIGVQVASPQQLQQLFDYYDTNKNGVLEYKEFAAIIFNNASPITRKLSPDTQKAKYKDTNIPGLLEKVRTTLRQRGAGLVALAKQFAIADKNRTRTLDKQEFQIAMKTFGTGLDQTEINIIFDHFDSDRSGEINYDEFVYHLVGEMNSFRRKLVEQAFNKLDKDASGDLTIEDLKDVYNAAVHPDVRAGKKTEKQVLTEFLKNFELLYDYNRIDDDKVTKEEFLQYYNFISASIDGDAYFETMINNSWKINEGAFRTTKESWSNKYENERGPKASNRGAYFESKKEEYKSRNEREETGDGRGRRRGGDYEQQQEQPQERTKKASVPQQLSQEEVLEGALNKLRTKLYTRGAKAFIGLQRQFKIMDDDNDKSLSFTEFSKACNDYKLDLNVDEVKALFNEFDIDGSGKISIDEFVRGVRGEMNEFRRNLVKQAFKVLDKDGDGVIRVNDLKTIYSAKNHPDVRSGRKTESDILGEFLETFETHHNIRKGARDQNVTLEEFLEYYNNVGANIDDDRYFETMILNGYKLGQQTSYEGKAAWGQSYKGEETQKKSRGGTTIPPYGVSDAPTQYGTTSQRPQTSQQGGYGGSRPETSGSVRGQGQGQSQQQIQGSRRGSDNLISIFREKVLARGARGILSLARLFRVIDDDNSGVLNLQEFTKCIYDLRFDFNSDEIKRLFAQFDTNRNGSIDYDEFLREVRGPMNQNRVNWVKEAYKKLDRDGSGVINVDDLRGWYSAKQHPDVKSGKRTEDEILVDFLDTFEQHHAVHTGDFKQRNAQVTFDEFLEYYNNISASIDDDRYFETMIKNAWKLDTPTTYGGQKAWRGDYGGR